jgi:hypothetical protein
MSVTRKTLRQAIDNQLRLIHGNATTTRTATGGSTTTLVDTARGEADDFWNNSWLYIASTTDAAAPQGQEALVTDFAAVTKTFTFTPAMTAAVGNGDTYELRRYFPAVNINQEINNVLEEMQAHFPVITEDETTVIETDIYDYTISATIKHILRIDLLNHDIIAQGTATAGAATTLTDSGQSWTTNEWANYELVIYEGTGAGQYRTISSNTATALTVSAAWDTNPDTTSKYKIKDVSETPPFSRLTRFTHVGTTLHITQDIEAGQRLRITYAPAHAALETDAATTSIPQVLVVDRALWRILSMSPITLPNDDMRRVAQNVARERWEASERFIQRNAVQRTSTFRNRGGQDRGTWYTNSSPTIGTREER